MFLMIHLDSILFKDNLLKIHREKNKRAFNAAY